MQTKLSKDDIQARLKSLAGWEEVDSVLTSSFDLPAYKDGLVLASAIGLLADQMDHHPDMHVGYRKVRVELSTHDAGGITELDFKLAEKINRLTARSN